MSSATEPFQPVETKYGVTRGVLEAMVERPPDGVILQSHSHRVVEYLDLYRALAAKTELRVHVSIETDRETLEGMPRHGSTVEKRMEACALLKGAGIKVLVAVAPLLPIERPIEFFEKLARVSDGVILDHFIGGDGSESGERTRRTPLPLFMEKVEERSVEIEYLREMEGVARRYFPGRVGVGSAGFAGRMG